MITEAPKVISAEILSPKSSQNLRDYTKVWVAGGYEGFTSYALTLCHIFCRVCWWIFWSMKEALIAGRLRVENENGCHGGKSISGVLEPHLTFPSTFTAQICTSCPHVQNHPQRKIHLHHPTFNKLTSNMIIEHGCYTDGILDNFPCRKNRKNCARMCHLLL